MTTSQICGRDPLVKVIALSGSAFGPLITMILGITNFLPVGWTPGDHREADQGVDGDVRLLINLADRVRRYRSVR
jgi:hypothetical protein